MQSLQPVDATQQTRNAHGTRCKYATRLSVGVVDDVGTNSTNQRLCLQTASVASTSAICHVSELEQLGDDTIQELLFD